MNGARGQEMGASVRKGDVPDTGKLPFWLDARHLSAPRIYGIALLVSSSADVSVLRRGSGHDCRAFIRSE
jgi:hypothetical protein